MRILLTGLVLFVFATAHALAADTPEHTKDSLKKVKKALKEKKAVLFDVRELKEWKAGHLEAAKLVPLSKLSKKSDDETFLKELKKKAPKGRIIYCHCKSGGRVIPASKILRDLGYDTRPLKHGYKALLEAGFKKAPDEDDEE